MEFPFPHKKNLSLSKFSSLGIGGPARYFTEAFSIEEMQERLFFSHQNSLPVLILGKGSNLLFGDEGYPGLVVLNKIDFLEEEAGNFSAGGGYSFARLGSSTARRGWSGLEFAAGIPASVGGAIYMNAGAGGYETADSLHEVGYVTEKGEFICLKRGELVFGYRSSPFQEKKGAIVSGSFLLKTSQDAHREQKTLLDYRLKTQPYGEKSAGCAFRNPEGVSAAKLIDECGLKGMQIGRAKVSEKHANFIVNIGGAKAQDVKELMNKIQMTIFEKKEILLEPEIRSIDVPS
ncbi:MAG: UDP-N-acetylenolpyruvoylglucosamine reductase [Chlamydiae bacterium]|nr:UDP-N-acetylenolpyruvoylglucosamine reductase [Chlamydiota bacterium]